MFSNAAATLRAASQKASSVLPKILKVALGAYEPERVWKAIDVAEYIATCLQTEQLREAAQMAPNDDIRKKLEAAANLVGSDELVDWPG
jgi:hypothetical protein